jgi:hypothetical protein
VANERLKNPGQYEHTLSDEDLRRVKAFAKSGMPGREIRGMFGLSKGQLKRIVKGG